MDVFERVINGTLYHEIKYQFDRGQFHVGWRSTTSGNAAFIRGLSPIRKKINNEWSQEDRDYLSKHYPLIFSFETVRKSLQFAFQTQDYWANNVQTLPPQQRKAFEKKLKQRLSNCRREIKKWFNEKQPQNRQSATNQENRHNVINEQRQMNQLTSPSLSSQDWRSERTPMKPQNDTKPRNAQSDMSGVVERREMDQRTLPNGRNGNMSTHNPPRFRPKQPQPQQPLNQRDRQRPMNGMYRPNVVNEDKQMDQRSSLSSQDWRSERAPSQNQPQHEPQQPQQPQEDMKSMNHHNRQHIGSEHKEMDQQSRQNRKYDRRPSKRRPSPDPVPFQEVSRSKRKVCCSSIYVLSFCGKPCSEFS